MEVSTLGVSLTSAQTTIGFFRQQASKQAGRQVQRTALSGLNPTAMVWPRWTADEERRAWR